MKSSNQIIFSIKKAQDGHIGLISLNRPEALNALNHEMITELSNYLKHWQLDASIKVVVIQSLSERAFCAGGDIRLTYEFGRSQPEKVLQFFNEEYQMNRLIYHYKKPYISLLNGITMGGGAGISINGQYRIGTENLIFAMPETGIGFFPDVGGTYFLSHLKYPIGIYLGLTGEKINADDCFKYGLINFLFESEDLNEIVSSLLELPQLNKDSISTYLTSLNRKEKISDLQLNEKLIEQFFSYDDVESILAALTQSSLPFAKKTLVTLSKKSPTSLKVTMAALKQAKNLDFDAAITMEYQLATQFLQDHDFLEGIRALLIDKDKTPKWQPQELSAVTKEKIEIYFCG